ncbi:MAG: GHKL domain-containing protein [Bacteroides sp.]|nr:GHKL domain-containing protein [Bacteroides sp.]
MSAEKLLALFADAAEFFILICCMDILSARPNNYRARLAAAFTAYTLISFAERFLGAELYGGPLPVVMYAAKFAAVILILYNKNKVMSLYVTYLTDSLLSFIYSSILAVLLNSGKYESGAFDTAVMLLAELALLTAAAAVRRRADVWRLRQTISVIPRHIFMLILLTASVFGGTATVSTSRTAELTLKQSALDLLTVALFLLVFGIIISLIFNVVSKERFSNTSAILEKQVEAQLRHYEKTEQAENELRRFRHDYTNHMQSLLSLIKMGEYTEAENYILKLRTAVHKTESLFSTGNKLADAILTDKSETLKENVTIDYHGVVPATVKNTDLCVILSNSLDNAIEACSKCDFACVISVTASVMQGYFVMTVKNPTVCSDCFTDIPPTAKPDKSEHGIGLINIRDTALKNAGSLSVRCEKNMFELSVTLKL